MKKNRKIVNIDASSMADIAFLLLTFFMMVTTINQDKGLLFKLPEYEKTESFSFAKRNVLEILVNEKGELMLNGERSSIEMMRKEVYLHITNKAKLLNYSTQPKLAIILLKNNSATKYEDYLLVQDELKSIYVEVRNETALYLSNSNFNYPALKDLSLEDPYYGILLKKVQDSIPFLVLENLPFEDYVSKQ